jgi:hypothetical protein
MEDAVPTPVDREPENLSEMVYEAVGTASAVHPDPSTLTPDERHHLGIE